MGGKTGTAHKIDNGKYSKTKKLVLHYSDLLDANSLNNLVTSIMPDEMMNNMKQFKENNYVYPFNIFILII